MDSDRFDELSRSMAGNKNRRSILRAIGALTLGASGVAGFRTSVGAAKNDKVNVCHRTGNGSYRYISVAASAVDAHVAHGDHVSNLDDVNNCGACGNVCSAPENGTALCGEDGCGFVCNEGFELNVTGDGCVATSLCTPGYVELNGGCFQIVDSESPCQASGCGAYGPFDGSDDQLCVAATSPLTTCYVTSDCPEGQACWHGGICLQPCPF